MLGDSGAETHIRMLGLRRVRLWSHIMYLQIKSLESERYVLDTSANTASLGLQLLTCRYRFSFYRSTSYIVHTSVVCHNLFIFPHHHNGFRLRRLCLILNVNVSSGTGTFPLSLRENADTMKHLDVTTIFFFLLQLASSTNELIQPTCVAQLFPLFLSRN